MIGLDTNILIRYIVQDDAKQARRATELIESMCTTDDPGFINLIVLCEICWVLSSGYKYDRKTVSAVVRNILTSEELTVEESETVWQALYAFEKGKAGIADYIIGIHNRTKRTTTTYTFDRNAAKHNSLTLLTSEKA
jgi:predicted nucleic-acid-binding protein